MLVRVTALAVTLGALVASAAAVDGLGTCAHAASVGAPADPVCFQLVRTLAGRVGVATAVATAVVVLTMIGLARTGRALEEARPRPSHRGASPL